MERDEQLLVARVGQGDERAFAVLYLRHFRRLFQFFFARFRNRQISEHLTQETFLRLWRLPPEPRGDYSTILPWLFRVAGNLAANQARSTSYPPDLSLDVLDDLPILGLSAGPRVIEDREDIHAALALLPEGQRYVLLLRFSSELSYREIAEVLDTDVNNVGSLIRTAIRALKRAVQAQADQAHRESES